MSELFSALSEQHKLFIQQQHIFFVGTADVDGYVNVSPKGMDSLRIIHSKKLCWLNLTGSGNETAAHIANCNRMTIMLCSFDKAPLILRVYGTANVAHEGDKGWDELLSLFPNYTGARQVFSVDIDLVQTSCGYAVPLFELTGERQTLNNWANKRG